VDAAALSQAENDPRDRHAMVDDSAVSTTENCIVPRGFCRRILQRWKGGSDLRHARRNALIALCFMDQSRNIASRSVLSGGVAGRQSRRLAGWVGRPSV
jgi:hypothetical protein